MGAYGSPELYPFNQQPNRKRKSNGNGCLKNLLILVCLLVVFFFLFVIVSTIIKNGGVSSSSSTDLLSLPPVPQKSTSRAVSSVPQKSISGTDSMPVFIAPKLTDDYLKLWAQGVVIKYWTAPKLKSAKFSDKPSDWIITSKGDLYGISSVVSSSKSDGVVLKDSFSVVILYTPDKGVQDIYLKVGNEVVFDKTASSKN